MARCIREGERRCVALIVIGGKASSRSDVDKFIVEKKASVQRADFNNLIVRVCEIRREAFSNWHIEPHVESLRVGSCDAIREDDGRSQ